ncbi:MAG: DUF721 domain-containing protein [Sphingomonadales bacterium]
MRAKTFSNSRRSKAVQLSSLVGRIGDKSFRRRGFVHAQIITDWPHIVGHSLASVTAPDRLRFPPGQKRGGTLTIRCDGSAALEVQHHSSLIIERVNIFFGYSAIERLSIRQGPLPAQRLAAPQNRPAPKPAPHHEKAVAADIKDIKNQDLKAALQRLGHTIMATQ